LPLLFEAFGGLGTGADVVREGGVAARERRVVLGDEGQDRVRESYGAEKYARLRELKRRYDPDNFFRINQNIPPS